MKHMGLFEGIGGFSLAARWAGWITPVMVEWNQYCQSVLRKNFPDATIFSDIRNFDGRPYAGQIDIITGGFPCQPFSHAGKRAGTDDDRYLWPEMLRVIREVGPEWIVGENVAGLLTMDGGRVLRGILADLENTGYRPEVFVIPALAVGAPHRRDRLWIVAHRDTGNCAVPVQPQVGRVKEEDSDAAGENCGVIANTNGSRGKEPGLQQPNVFAKPNKQTTSDSHKQRLEKRKSEQRHNGAQQPPAIRNIWSQHWYEVATRICGMAHGFPRGMDGVGEIPAKKNTGKAARLEGLGNAIVPEIAYQIFEAINETVI